MLSNFSSYLAWTRKALINLTGLLTSLLAYGLLPDPYNKYAASTLAVVTVISHFLTPNSVPPGNAVAEEVTTDEVTEEIPDEWKPAELVTASHVAATQKQAAPPSTTDTTATSTPKPSPK